ncbi:MAG: leucine-rich repeat domain-containing protein [Clostridia bacterium]|nr:leucine-rich repeat domain-containing protein [Clostridia bacterium]
MKKFIKIIALTLTVAMLAVGLVACSGGSAQDEEGEWGDFSWSYKKDTKTLTVTGSGDMPNAENSADVPWAAIRPYIEAVRLRAEGAPVTSVGDYAFYGLIRLEEVELDENVKKIGKCAFAFCALLDEVNLSEGLESVGESAFEGCASLVAIELPASVATIGVRAFAFCRELNAVTVNGKPAELGDWLFKDCVELDTVRMNREGVTVSDSAFEGAGMNKDGIKSLQTSLVTIVCKDADGTEIYTNPAAALLEVGVAKDIEAPEVSGYKLVGEATKSVTGTGEAITVEFSYEKIDDEEEQATNAPVVETPEKEENDKPNVMTIIAIIIFVVVIIGIAIGAFLLIRSDKKTTKDSMTVRKNKDGKGKK